MFSGWCCACHQYLHGVIKARHVTTHHRKAQLHKLSESRTGMSSSSGHCFSVIQTQLKICAEFLYTLVVCVMEPWICSNEKIHASCVFVLVDTAAGTLRHPSFHPSIHLSILPSIFPSFRPSVHLSFSPSFHLSFLPSFRLYCLSYPRWMGATLDGDTRWTGTPWTGANQSLIWILFSSTCHSGW